MKLATPAVTKEVIKRVGITENEGLKKLMFNYDYDSDQECPEKKK
jgi:hypothetical protein